MYQLIGGGVEGIDATEDCNNLASSACNEVPPPVEGGLEISIAA